MGLMFDTNGILERSNGLTYDDVLLMPRHCEITSRTIPNLRSRITKNFSTDIPFIAANMDTVTEESMAIAMGQIGAVGSLHRFLSVEQQCEEIKNII